MEHRFKQRTKEVLRRSKYMQAPYVQQKKTNIYFQNQLYAPQPLRTDDGD